MAALQDRTNEALISQFYAATRSNTGATADTYARYLRTGLKLFTRVHGFEPHLLHVATDRTLAAMFLSLTIRLRGYGQLSRRTVAQRRKALAAFAAWLPPAIRPYSEIARNQAREAYSIRRGVKLVTPGTAPAATPSFIPSDSDLRAVIEALLADGTETSRRVADLAVFLDQTGIRIGAALALKHGDTVPVGDGYSWLTVHEKSRPDRRPVRATEQVAAALKIPGRAGQPVWPVGTGELTQAAVRRCLRAACDVAGIRRFTPHALRHRHAHRNADFFDLPDLMAEGGWRAKEMAEHYADHEPIG
jgi:integrase